jgi:hypothetical protein
MFSDMLLTILFFQPWVAKRYYWVMHGGDFYFPAKQSLVKKKMIKRIRYFITYLKGDFEYLKTWYGAKGEYHECFMYPSNIYKEYNVNFKKDNALNIQIEVLEKLRKYKNENIKVYVPLSYGGDQSYADAVVSKGKEIIEDRFIPILNFMQFKKYLNFTMIVTEFLLLLLLIKLH